MDLNEISHELSRQSSKAINDWLERCVIRFCQEAIPYIEAKDWMMVSKVLEEGHFNYLECGDGIFEFRQESVVLARCKSVIKLTNSTAPIFKENLTEFWTGRIKP